MSYQQFARTGNEASWGFAFGNRLTKLMEERGVKVSALSRKTGVPESTIKAAMRGSTIPNYYRMMLIADGLGISLDKLTDLRPFADLDDLEDDEDMID